MDVLHNTPRTGFHLIILAVNRCNYKKMLELLTNINQLSFIAKGMFSPQLRSRRKPRFLVVIQTKKHCFLVCENIYRKKNRDK